MRFFPNAQGFEHPGIDWEGRWDPQTHARPRRDTYILIIKKVSCVVVERSRGPNDNPKHFLGAQNPMCIRKTHCLKFWVLENRFLFCRLNTRVQPDPCLAYRKFFFAFQVAGRFFLTVLGLFLPNFSYFNIPCL